MQDFYFISSGSNGSINDELYLLAASSTTAGTIYKYSLVSGSWTANGSYATSFGGFGLCAAKNGSGAVLYVTTGTGATAANSVIKLTDAAGYNSPISITTGNNVTLYTAAAGTTMKGIAFAPTCTAPTAMVRSADSTTICSGSSATLHADLTGTGPWNVTWSDGTSAKQRCRKPRDAQCFAQRDDNLHGDGGFRFHRLLARNFFRQRHGHRRSHSQFNHYRGQFGLSRFRRQYSFRAGCGRRALRMAGRSPAAALPPAAPRIPLLTPPTPAARWHWAARSRTVPAATPMPAARR